jgi:hypothetical protein
MGPSFTTLVAFTAVFILAFSCAPLACHAEGVPSFGSMYAGKMGLAVNHSDLKPKKILKEPGSLEGKWLSGEKSILEVSLDSSLRNDFNSQKYCEAFKHDCFVIRIKGTDVTALPLTAAYEEFRIYGADLTGEGTDAVVIESGEGRGTSVHVRSVKIYKIEEGHFVPIFEAKLNGYLANAYDPEIKSVEPLTWERKYYFKKNKKNKALDIILQLDDKPKIMHGVAKLDDLFDIQAKKIVNKYDRKRQSYFLDKVILEPNEKEK